MMTKEKFQQMRRHARICAKNTRFWYYDEFDGLPEKLKSFRCTPVRYYQRPIHAKWYAGNKSRWESAVRHAMKQNYKGYSDDY